MLRITTPLAHLAERTILSYSARSGALGLRTICTQAPENRVPPSEVIKSLLFNKVPDRNPPVQVTTLPDHELKALCEKNYVKQLEALNNPPSSSKDN